MQFESTTIIDASAAQIFSIYAKVNEWPLWDADAKEASLDGAFVSGAKGVVVPHGGPKSQIVLSNVQLNRSFTVTCKLPLCVMGFDYLLEPQAGTGAGGEVTKVTHGVRFEGFLAPVFGRLIGNGMRKSLPNTLSALKALVKSR